MQRLYFFFLIEVYSNLEFGNLNIQKCYNAYNAWFKLLSFIIRDFLLFFEIFWNTRFLKNEETCK